MNNHPTIKNDERRPDVEAMLSDFFQAELPEPWPTLRLPQATQPRRVGSFWSQSSGRLALAACIALLVAGYVALSGMPRQQANPQLQEMHKLGQGHKKGPAPD